MTQPKMRQKPPMLPLAKSLPTGRPDEPPANPFHGLTASQIDSMTLKEVEEHGSSRKMENTWKLAREVSDRIKFNSVSSYSKKQQILHFLAKYLIRSKKPPASK